MTSRAIWPEGVEVHQTALAFDSTSHIFDAQRRFDDIARPGRASGLGVTIGSPTSRFTVGAGWGWTLRGDYVASPGVVNIALSDYSTGVENLIVLAYRENLTTPEAHEDGQTTRNTIAQAASELKVITRTEYNALPASANSDLAVNLLTADVTTDAQDRMLILASVLGKGFTGPTPNGYVVGDFSNGNILQQALVTTILTASLPTSPTGSGVNLKAIDASNPVGTGTLTIIVNSSTDKRISWQAPGDGAADTPTIIDLTQDVVSYKLNSGSPTSGKFLTVEVVPSLLPPTVASFADTVTVASLYDDAGPVVSASDRIHRSKLGTYIPTPADAHGTGYQDFAQQVANIPVTALLGTGRLASATQALMARLTTPRSTVGGVARTLMWSMPGGTGAVVRFYKNSTDDLEITVNAYWEPVGALWHTDGASATRASLLYIGQAFSSFGKHDGGGTWANWDLSALVTDNLAANLGILNLGSGFLGSSADALNPRIRADFSTAGGVTKTLLLASQVTGNAGTLRIYKSTATGANSNNTPLEATLNAVWSNGSGQWTLDDNVTNTEASKFEFGRTGIRVYHHNSGGPSSWTDSFSAGAWDVESLKTDQFGNIQAGVAFLNQVDTGAATRSIIRQAKDSSTGVGYRDIIAAVGGSIQYENTINCFFSNGAAKWNADNTGKAANLKVNTTFGTISYIKSSTGTPWTDTVGAGGWDAIDWELNSAGFGIFVAPLSGSPLANSLYGDNIEKCWGSVTFNDSASPAVGGSFNVSSVTCDALGGCTVTFTTPMANTNYSVFLTADSLGAVLGPLGSMNSPYPFVPVLKSKTTNGFTFQVAWFDTGATTFQMVRLDTGSTVNGVGIHNNAVHFRVSARQ